MDAGQALVLLSVLVQSAGKVLYGTLLTDVSIAAFVLLSFCLCTGVFLAIVRGHLPRAGRRDIVRLNLWTPLAFFTFFYALKHLPPAVVGAIEIGVSLVAASVLVGLRSHAWPRPVRLAVCAGITLGCALVAASEVPATLAALDAPAVWLALLASAVAGVASVFTAAASRRLAAAGWSPATVLAHRFYVTIALALVLLPFEQSTLALPDLSTLVLTLFVGAVGVLSPLLLFQMALRRIDELTLMICLAAQPLLSYFIALPSPAYTWNWVTLAGVAVVTVSLVLDVLASRQPASARPAG